MLQATRGILLRSIKYGESSLIISVFTEQAGIQSYMMRGIRGKKTKNTSASLLQPAALLDMIVYRQPLKNLQNIREYHAAFLYSTLHESVIKNSIALFTVELLYKILPENGIALMLFEFSFNYFVRLDSITPAESANFPLYFTIQCGRILGYDFNGDYSVSTPYLNIIEGGFSSHPATVPVSFTEAEISALQALVNASGYEEVTTIAINGSSRMKLLEWYIAFLQHHVQYIGNLKSLAVIRSVFHS